MVHVYHIGSIYGDGYVSTLREVKRARPGGELPDSFSRVDAVAECNKFLRVVDDLEKEANAARLLLQKVADARDVSVELLSEIDIYFAANPMPPATAADRDGQRSYGG